MTFLNHISRIHQRNGIHRLRVLNEVIGVNNGALGRVYKSGDTIIRQGDPGICMYVIQEGEVEVIGSFNGNDVRLAVLGKGDIFGEISLLGNGQRSATVLAIGEVRVITVDKRVLLQRLQEDVTLAFRIFQTMAARITAMNSEMAVLKSASFTY